MSDIDPSGVQWDADTAIDPSQVNWDDSPKPYTPSNETLRFGPWNTHIPLNPKVADVLAGAGKSMVGVAQGIGQDVGLVSRSDVQRMRDTESMLPNNPYTKAGGVVGDIAAYAPAAFIPGANTILGGAAIGAGLGLAQPSTSTRETVGDVLGGAALGGVGGGVGRLAGALKGKAPQVFTGPNADIAQGELERQTQLTQVAAQRGLKLPPVGSTQGEFDAAAETNIPLAEDMAREDVNLPSGTPLSGKMLASYRNKIGQQGSYGAIRQIDEVPLRPDTVSTLQSLPDNVQKQLAVGKKLAGGESVNGSDAIDLWTDLKDKANDEWTAFDRTSFSERKASAQQFTAAAKSVKQSILDHLNNSGQSDVANQLDSDTQLFARTYTLQSAIKNGNLDVSRLVRANAADEPLSGNMSLLSEVADRNPEAFRLSRVSKPSPGFLRSAAQKVIPAVGTGIGATVGAHFGAPALGSILGQTVGENTAESLAP